MLLALCDLDGTFIQTSRHVSEEIKSHLIYTSDSNKKLVITDRQLKLFNFLNTNGIVIPVTARSLESLQRLRSTLNFKHEKICSHGAIIYNKDNMLDTEYNKFLRDLVMSVQEQFVNVFEFLSKCKNNNVFSNLKFTAIKSKDIILNIEIQTETVNHVAIIITSIMKLNHNLKDLVVAYNGKSISITAFKNSYKDIACKYLIENKSLYQNLPTLGFGDSFTDLSFMKQCDFSVIPNTESTQINIGS